ncbi:MAG: hypothetical protein KAJ81_09260 [Candidatus Latescibacteria bacterium]|nr:hypothetical protein [Candidatus Latescibacterota bacterium]
MASPLKRIVLRPVPYLFSDRAGLFLTRVWSKKLREELYGKATDTFLELLLKGMDLAFCLSKGYRKNIKKFEGRYFFRTADQLVAAVAIFKNGNMKVREEATDEWNVRITFKDAEALRAFLFSGDQDILDSLLKNDVEVDGNLNYVYKFGFMARDLFHRLGVG